MSITAHSLKSNAIAAVLLLVLLATLVAHRADAADPMRLERIGVIRFSPLGDDKLVRQSGTLSVKGEIAWRFSSSELRPANTPPSALNRILISREAWSNYYSLGFGALQGFMLEEGGVTAWIGTERFHFVAPDPDATAYFHDGRLINISTRANLAGAGDEIIAGFVIEHRPRTVLIRAVGPGLAQFGVTHAAPDPFLSVKRGGLTEHFNDNWSTRPDADVIAFAATRAGAFPLAKGSADAARVLVLQPGVYTVHATTAGPAIAGGAVLLEVYSLPDDLDYEDLNF